MDEQTRSSLLVPVGMILLLIVLAINHKIFGWIVPWLAIYDFIKEANLNYFSWYIKNGAGINAAVGVIALVWEGVRSRKDMLSIHPLRYIRATFLMAGVLFYSLAAHINNVKYVKKDAKMNLFFGIYRIFQMTISLVLASIIAIFGIVWLLFVTPLNYFIVLVSGAPAREYLRRIGSRPIIEYGDDTVTLKTQPIKDELPPNAIDISIAREPFAITQLLTSMVLLLMNFILPTFGITIN